MVMLGDVMTSFDAPGSIAQTEQPRAAPVGSNPSANDHPVAFSGPSLTSYTWPFPEIPDIHQIIGVPNGVSTNHLQSKLDNH